MGSSVSFCAIKSPFWANDMKGVRYPQKTVSDPPDVMVICSIQHFDGLNAEKAPFGAKVFFGVTVIGRGVLWGQIGGHSPSLWYLKLYLEHSC